MAYTEGTALVLRWLEVATSQNVSLLPQAEENLKKMERESGFYSTLQAIYLDHTQPMNVRWLAVVYFKNGIERYWRKTAPNAICEEEKTLLRTRMISNFNEPVPQIATQISVLIGKIARVDCPRFWPELIPTLMQTIQSEEKLIQQRSLLALHHVIKALASKRLLPDRQIFADLTENMFQFTMMIWSTYAQNILVNIKTEQCDRSTVVELFNAAQICLKVLRKLFVHGFRDDTERQDMTAFIRIVLEQIDHFLEIGRMEIVSVFQELREKYITLLTKVLLDAVAYHALWFVPFLEPVVTMVTKYNFTNHGNGIVYERFTVNSFILIKDILRYEGYKEPKNATIEDTAKNSRSREAASIKRQLFTEQTMVELTRQLVCKYFLYTMDDLNEWESNPEEFISEESGDVWKYSLRPCAEVLFLIVLKEQRETVTPFLIEMVKRTQDMNYNDLNSMVEKDAIFNAIGLASFDLYDDIDFNQWFTTTLVPQLSDPSTNKLLQRRLIWLIGQWVNVNLKSELRPTLYELIVELLKPDHDLVVRLQAANTLKLTIDDFEFKIDQFLPYLESNFALLFELLRSVVECETKMQILHVMSFMIERSDKAIKPHCPALLQYLPQLWAASEQHNLLRCAIMTTLMHLTKQGLGVECVRAYDLLLPIIQMSTDLQQPHHVYLMEDALDLWKVTLQCSPTNAAPALLELYKNMPALLELGSETLVICLKIIECYLYLDAKLFMQNYAESLVTSLMSMCTDMRDEGLVAIHKIIELSIKLLPLEAPRLFETMLLNILKSIFSSESHYSVLLSVDLSIIARVYLMNQEYFWHLLNIYAQIEKQTPDALFDTYLDVFIDRLDIVVQPEKRKLCGLAIASMITSEHISVRQRFDSIISMCVEILHDVCRLKDDGSCTQVDYFLLNSSNTDDTDDYYEPNDEDENSVPVQAGGSFVRSDDDPEHEKRKRLARQQDPVYTVSMKQFTSSQLQALQRSLGDGQFQQMMSLIDSEITHQLKFLLK